tara:strand:+ start:1230 stop:1601 length:372 start_codon:yes stop_codon:yes gene_type:complete
MTDEWFDNVRKAGRRIYVQGLREELLKWAETKKNGYKIEAHELQKLMKPKYQKRYLEYLKKSSSVKKPRKGAFTGPAGQHAKAKFDGRAIGVNVLMGKILKMNGWVKNKTVYEKIHERKAKKK